MKTHRKCNRCGSVVTKVTDKNIRQSMHNRLNPNASYYAFECKECDEFLFRFETINIKRGK